MSLVMPLICINLSIRSKKCEERHSLTDLLRGFEVQISSVVGSMKRLKFLTWQYLQGWVVGLVMIRGLRKFDKDSTLENQTEVVEPISKE